MRTALEALAAVLGGTQSLHTNSFDEALALPTEDAVRIALRTQQVIAHETGVVNTIDPLGGSYFVESLTNRLEAEAYDYFDADRTSSAASSPRSRRTSSSARSPRRRYRYQQEVEHEQRIVVGVNRYQLEDELPIEILKIDPASRAARSIACRRCERGRDSAAVEAALGELRSAAAADERNLMPPIVDAVARVRDDGRDVRRLPRGLGHLARNARLLANSLGDLSSNLRAGEHHG